MGDAFVTTPSSGHMELSSVFLLETQSILSRGDHKLPGAAAALGGSDLPTATVSRLP